MYAENIWPDGRDAFRRLHLSIGHQLHQVGLHLLEGAERALGLEQGVFAKLAAGAAHVTRSLRYLPVTQAHLDAEVLWGEEHTDFNLLTLLGGGRFFDPEGQSCPRPDQSSGLYLRTRATAEHPGRRMIRGVAPAGHIVSQVGQQLEILTGGRFQATPHVVRAPTTPGYTRTSMAHFVHVNALRTLWPLPRFRTPEAIDAYRPPVLAGNYGMKTLVDIGLAPTSNLSAFGYRHYDRLADARATE